jgi:hypothetical protein
MVLVHEGRRPVATWEFDADIAILTHSTTIQPRYQVGICVFGGVGVGEGRGAAEGFHARQGGFKQQSSS